MARRKRRKKASSQGSSANTVKKNFYIDSIECQTARIVEEDSTKSYTIPLQLLPRGAEEDEWFSMETKLLPKKCQNLGRQITDLFAQLEKGDS